MTTPQQLLIREVTFMSVSLVVLMMIIMNPTTAGMAWVAAGLALVGLVYLNVRVRRIVRRMGEGGLEHEVAGGA
jgi:hypothetical protein